MTITQLALTGFSSGIGVGCAVLALMSSYQAVVHSLRELD